MDQLASFIVICEKCGMKNRIPEIKATEPARCGNCEATLSPPGRKSADAGVLTLRCSKCRTKNRVAAAKINDDPKCGRCGASIPTQHIMSPSPVMISDANFEEMVLNSPLPVLMYSWAPWCSGCKATSPIIQQFAADAKGRIRVGKLNVEANPMLTSQYRIMSLPFLHIFDGGQVQESLPAMASKHDLMMKMAHYL